MLGHNITHKSFLENIIADFALDSNASPSLLNGTINKVLFKLKLNLS